MFSAIRRLPTQGPEEHWYRSAALDERLRLFSVPALLAFFASMAVVLWLALPGASLADRLAQSGRSDQLSVAYLRAWLAAQPDDLPLHLSLARKHLRLGDWDAAIAALARPIGDGAPALRRDAQWLRLEVLEQQASATEPGSPEHRAALDAVLAQLHLLAVRTPEDRDDPASLDVLLARALAHGQTALARDLLARRAALAGPSGAPQTDWLARLARDAEALGDPLLGARLRWRAFDSATTDAERRAHLFAAVRLMQSADRTGDALDEAQARIGRLDADTGLMRFMVRLAMAAGRPDIAERYAREMLRFALMQQWQGLLADRSSDGEAPALRSVALEAGAADGEPRPKQPRLPFDDATYALAYEVFLANGNQRDAYEVAAAAVRQAPADLAWRRRLAQIAEWTSRGDVALEQWLHLARAEGQPEAWARVERIAGQLGDGAVLLEALRVRARGANDETLDVRVAELVETLGDAAGSARWMEARIAARGIARSRALVARLLVLRAEFGDRADYVAWLDRADAAYGPEPRRAIARALIAMERSDVAGAFAALHVARDAAVAAGAPKARDDAEDTYWHLYVDLARRLQREVDADFAYRQLVRIGKATPEDLIAWSGLVEDESIRAAAWIAEHAWLAGRSPPHAERAFGLWLRLGDFASLERLGATLDPALRESLESEVGYLQALSAHLQARGDDAGARRALEQALAVAPDDALVRAAVMWMLLAQKQADALRTALLRGEARAEREPALWGVHAAAWMALDEPQRALRWCVRQAKSGSDDYLWQMGYADCLERNGLADSAWTVRRRVWTEMRREPAARWRADPWREQSMLALAMRFAPTDSVRTALRETMDRRERALLGARRALADVGSTASTATIGTGPPRTDLELIAWVDAETALARAAGRDADDETPDQRASAARGQAAGARELVLSWQLSRESSDAARAWLLSRYATELERPAWATLSLALADGDTQAMTALLDGLPDWLPRLEQVDAMRATGRRAQAQSVAWTLATERPAVDEARQRLVDTVLPDASFALAEVAGAEIGALGVRTDRLSGSLAVRPGWSAGIVIERERLRANDDAQLVGVPGEASRVGATLRWRGDTHVVESELSRYDAVRERTGLRMAWRPQDDRGPSVAVGLRQPATESAPLRVGGTRDTVALRWAQPITGRDRIAASVTPTRLASQDGTALASGTVWSLDGSHRLHLGYPDVSLKAILTHSDWRARGAVDSIVAALVPAAFGDPTPSIVPASATELAAGVAIGESIAQSYSRAPRPYGEALLRSNSVSGGGYAMRGGVTASVFGADRLSAFFSLVSVTPGLPRGSRAFGIAYQLFF